MKKLLSTLLAIVMLLSLLPSAAMAANYSDVSADDWFAEAVAFTGDNGIMTGTDKGFEPYADTTRAMLWTILARLSGLDVSATGENWFAEAQLWCISNGISDGSDPNGIITREQLAVMLYRFAVFMGIDVSVGEDTNILSYADAFSISDYAFPAMQWACGAGIINGIDGALVPQGSAVRAQVATMLMRFCALMTPETEKKTYTVTFVQYDGTSVSVQVKEGESVQAPAVPGRSGYTFAGWYTAAQGGSAFSFGSKVTANIVLYARWNTASSYLPIIVPSHIHSWSAWTPTAATHSRSCECGETQTADHSWSYTTDWSGSEPVNKQTCTVCGYEAVAADQTTYELASVADLLAFDRMVEANKTFFGKTVKLMADLDLASVSVSADGAAVAALAADAAPTFTGIGSQTSSDLFPSYCFNGTFDGQNHTISNMALVNEIGNKASAGFFNGLGNNAQVKNLKFERASVTSTHYAGVVAGYCNNSTGTGSVADPKANIDNCHVNNSTVTSKAHNETGAYDDGDKVGGIIGFMNFTVTNCSVTNSTLKAVRDLGGIVGIGYGAVVNCSIQNVTLIRDISNIDVEESKTNVDNHIGRKESGYSITNCTGTATKVVEGTYVASGVTSSGSTYYISSVDGLNWFNDQINKSHNSFDGKTIKLAADIDYGNGTWLPAGQNDADMYDGIDASYNTVEFKGTFDGNGKTISKINIAGLDDTKVSALTSGQQQVYSVAFIGYTSGATIKNLKMNTVTVTGSHYVAAIVGMTDAGGSIKDCQVNNATITCKHLTNDQCGDKAGGIVGILSSENTALSGCTVTNSAIKACRDAGQVVGAARSGKVTSCSATDVTVESVAEASSCCSGATNHGGNIRSEVIGRDIT